MRWWRRDCASSRLRARPSQLRRESRSGNSRPGGGVAKTETAQSAARVLVAMDAETLNALALKAGAGLAAALGARLEALFVENADLVSLGGLPFASEISALTGAWRDVAVEEIERALRLEAARIEHLVAEAAEQ